jgi:RAB protein geranylgeranyltransferase component A
LEFQNIINNYICLKDKFMKIPFSKSEVFMNTDLNLREKRNLVKIINQSMHFNDKYGLDEDRDHNSTHVYEKDVYVSSKEDADFVTYKDKPISEYLAHQKIDSKLCYILLYALGNVNESQQNPDHISIEKITTIEFFSRICKYLRSIGYYGHTPMLMANYGTSEYVQSFSRVGSIYGAIYILNDRDLTISNPVINENNKLESINLSMNDTPLIAKEGFVIGKEYEHLFNKVEEDDLFTAEK